MNQKCLFIKIIIFGLIFISINSIAQKTVINIIDKETLEPCPFTNVVLYDKDDNYFKGLMANNNGIATFEINEKSKIIVSFIGYMTVTDYISPGENKTIELSPDFIGLEEVVVTGQFQPKKADQSIYKIDVINSMTLKERGVTNLAEALSTETNIRLSVDPSTGTSIIMQGMGGENVKYLIDGVPIVGRVDGNIDLSQINMENVDHIEIVNGPMSVVYGTSALAGVINIITKQNTKSNNIVKANSYMDNKNNYNFGLYGSIIRKKHSLTLSGNRDLFQGVDINLDPDDAKHIEDAYGQGKDRYMEFKPKKVINTRLEYAYRNKHFQFMLKSQLMNLLLKNYTNPTQKLISSDADYYTTRSTNSLTIIDKISNTLSYNIIGAYTYYGRKTDFIESNLISLDKVVTETSSTVFHNGMTRGNFTFAKEESVLSYQFGWDINYDVGIGDRVEKEAQLGDFAAFLSAQYVPIKKLSLQPGFRYIYNTVYDAPFIPSINLQWNIIEDLNFRISYAKGFKAPSLKQLYLDFKDSNHSIEGNKDLKAETSDSYNASFSFKYGKGKQLFKFEPSFFYNDKKDAIVLIETDISDNSATYENLTGKITQGADIHASYLHFIGLSIGLGYNITGESVARNDSANYTAMFYYENYSINAKFNFRKYKTVLAANTRFYNTTPYYIDELNPSTQEYEYHLVYTEPYADLEVTLTKLLWKNKLSIVAGAKNLFDNYYKLTNGYLNTPTERKSPSNYGRTFFVKVNINLNN